MLLGKYKVGIDPLLLVVFYYQFPNFASGMLTLKRREVEKLAEDTNQKVVENVKKDLAANKPDEPIVRDEPIDTETKKSK